MAGFFDVDGRISERMARRGPAFGDRWLVERPVTWWITVVVGLSAVFMVTARLLFPDDDSIAADAVQAVVFAVVFTSTFLLLWRRPLQRALARWDARGDRGEDDAPPA